MLTRFAKILTVMVAFASIALMGAALTISNAGPNWRSESEELPDYTFTQDATTKLWSVEHRQGESLKTGVPHPGTIAEAYRHAAEQNKTELDVVFPQIEPLEQQIKEINAFRRADEVGLEARNTQLQGDFKTISTQVIAVGLAADKNAQSALDTRTKAAARREDGQRLLLQLEGIETDHFHLKEQRRRLLDTLYQMQGLLIRLRDRNTQLKSSGVDPAYKLEATPAVPTPPAAPAQE